MSKRYCFFSLNGCIIIAGYIMNAAQDNASVRSSANDLMYSLHERKIYSYLECIQNFIPVLEAGSGIETQVSYFAPGLQSCAVLPRSCLFSYVNVMVAIPSDKNGGIKGCVTGIRTFASPEDETRRSYEPSAFAKHPAPPLPSVVNTHLGLL